MKYISTTNGYILLTTFVYKSKRYGKEVTLNAGYFSDGATGAMDIESKGWWVHDKLCNTGEWDDGSKCNNWQASRVLGDILREEGRPIRSITWMLATWMFGGGKARDNGML